ncbi:hypothetical protein JTB14_003897 [Gonioctena quinquepunctata]|nr:hypothetical protein JTB14_003897 [Gonioctena quinquepunctata]
MQCLPDFICTECNQEFESASLLLQHFATHVIPNSEQNTRNIGNSIDGTIGEQYEFQFENDKGSDSGFEDIHPIKLCLATIDDKIGENSEKTRTEHCDLSITRKYQCTICEKKFGWSTDLKRHILIHTGERPFRCDMCTSSFTRNFLLQKHQRKVHSAETKLEIPDLMPISNVKRKKDGKSAKNC